MDLVCLNGVVPARMTFAALVRELGAERQVTLCDLVGYRDPLPTGYTLDSELAALGETVGAGAHLLGYSAGASVALAFAARHPTRVASLTLVEPPWTGLPDPSAFTPGMDRIMLDTPPELRWSRFHELLTRPGAAVPPPLADPPAWATERVARGGDIWRALRAATITPARVAAVEAPVYLPYADDSHPFFTHAAAELAGLFPRARAELYRGNHLRPPHVSEPGRFVAALRELWRG